MAMMEVIALCHQAALVSVELARWIGLLGEVEENLSLRPRLNPTSSLPDRRQLRGCSQLDMPGLPTCLVPDVVAGTTISSGGNCTN